MQEFLVYRLLSIEPVIDTYLQIKDFQDLCDSLIIVLPDLCG